MGTAVNHNGHGGQINHQGLLLTVAGGVLCTQRRQVAQTGTAEFGTVGIQYRGPLSAVWDTQAVAFPVDRGEITHNSQRAARFVPPQECDGVGGIVIRGQPGKALPPVILLPQGGLL